MIRILVTNDDGIDSPGLHAVVAAISDLGDVVVIAPDRNRSGVSRSITLGTTLVVTEAEVPGARLAFATDGTPTDCVRMAALGLAGEPPQLIVSGANQGLNVGDDVTYSGTVAAAMEAVMNGRPAIAISQQSLQLELGYPLNATFEYTAMEQFLRGLVVHTLKHLDDLPTGLVLNVNVPGLQPAEIAGVEITKLGRRIYRDRLELQSDEGGMSRYSLYGDDPSHHEEAGTDIAAIGRSCISLTALRFNLVDNDAHEFVESWPLDGFLAAASDGDTALGGVS
ncbi:MAG: 5'/3'-nucleotidase SurE [Thermoleophilia bacterium]|nr:5'/3'-nucleotidase SurE [Thermoleophilia bacterium]